MGITFLQLVKTKKKGPKRAVLKLEQSHTQYSKNEKNRERSVEV